MASRKAQYVLIGIGALGVAISCIVWIRLNTVSEASNPTEYWRRAGAEVYGKMASAPLEDAEAIAYSLAKADVRIQDHALSKTDPRIAMLRDTVREFLIQRYTAVSAAEYVRWMETEGYSFKTLEEFEPLYGPLSHNAARAGFDGTDVAEVFAVLWEYPPSKRAVPTMLATGPDAMAIEIASANHNRGFTGRLAGTLGEQLWHGGSAATCRFWMQPPVTREALVARYGEILAAQVGVIGVVPDRSRRPIIVQCFFDPQSQSWWLDGINVTNFRGSNTIWTCCEY
ncbi:MAG: hypothetical protein Q9O74_07585 [Planctomycetota bacterium]|nr:hypothetical protein [Planctomycetota bacterium]